MLLLYAFLTILFQTFPFCQMLPELLSISCFCCGKHSLKFNDGFAARYCNNEAVYYRWECSFLLSRLPAAECLHFPLIVQHIVESKTIVYTSTDFLPCRLGNPFVSLLNQNQVNLVKMQQTVNNMKYWQSRKRLMTTSFSFTVSYPGKEIMITILSTHIIIL